MEYTEFVPEQWLRGQISQLEQAHYYATLLPEHARLNADGSPAVDLDLIEAGIANLKEELANVLALLDPAEYSSTDEAVAQAWVDGHNEGVKEGIPQIYLDAYDHLVALDEDDDETLAPATVGELAEEYGEYGAGDMGGAVRLWSPEGGWTPAGEQALIDEGQGAPGEHGINCHCYECYGPDSEARDE